MTMTTTEADSTEFLFARSILVKLYLGGNITIGQYEAAVERAREEYNPS